MENLKKIGLPVLIALLVGAAFGWFGRPAKVEVREKIVVQEKEVIKWKQAESKNKQNDKIVVKIETILPDGTRKIETRIVDRGSITIDRTGEGSSETDTKIEKETEKVTEYSKNDWNLGVMYAPVSPGESALGNQTLGVFVNRRILGPIYVGGFGLSNKTLGVSLGLGL